MYSKENLPQTGFEETITPELVVGVLSVLSGMGYVIQKKKVNKVD
ncbi:LPXTG cell wall anchor domain-containing protein [Aerococcus christensenii]